MPLPEVPAEAAKDHQDTGRRFGRILVLPYAQDTPPGTLQTSERPLVTLSVSTQLGQPVAGFLGLPA